MKSTRTLARLVAVKSTRTLARLAVVKSTYLSETGGEEDALEELAHLLQELVDVGSLEDVDLVHRAVDLHRHDEVSVVYRLQQPQRHKY